MRTLISFCVSFLPLVLWAAPKPLSAGVYAYSDFSIQTKKRYEVVYTSTSAGKSRLNELKQGKYICENKGSETFLCSAFLSVADSEREIAGQVEKELSNQPLEILESNGEAELISESPALIEWKIPQSVRFKGQEYNSYRLMQKDHLEKIFFGEPAVETFVLDEKKTLNYPMQILVNESKTSYFKYFLLARYRSMEQRFVAK